VGGKDNYAADREAVRHILRTWLDVRDMARANRAFVQRAVRFLTGEAATAYEHATGPLVLRTFDQVSALFGGR
jgi:hypothetical protein